MRSRLLIPVLALSGLGAATLAWAQKPAPDAGSAASQPSSPTPVRYVVPTAEASATRRA